MSETQDEKQPVSVSSDKLDGEGMPISKRRKESPVIDILLEEGSVAAASTDGDQHGSLVDSLLKAPISKDLSERSEDVQSLHSNRSRLRADDLNSRQIDKILSEDFKRLTFHERNAIYEEMHGVANSSPKETPEMLEQSLQQFRTTLQNMPKDKKKAYHRTQTLYPQSYLHQYATQLRFLRAECFDIAKAVQRFVNFCEVIPLYFGQTVLERPLQLKDLGKDGIKVLKLGNYQLLPFRDRSGRRVFASVTDFAFHTPFEVRCKIVIYLIWVAMEDVESQQNGIVFVNWPDPTVPLFPEYKEHVLGVKVQQALPARIAVVHLCLPDTPIHQILKAHHASILGKDMRNRLKIITGKRTEIEYQLQSYGIPMDLWPVTPTGNNKTANLFAWIKTRKVLEGESIAQTESGNYIVSGSVVVECPGNGDILFRSGRSYLQHRGNQMFHDLIASKADSHNAAKSNDKKVKITWEIMEQVYATNGRFLEWNTSSNYWVVTEDKTKIRNKIAVYIRDFRRQLNANNNVQKVQSSTSKFEGQDGHKRKRGWRCWGNDTFCG